MSYNTSYIPLSDLQTHLIDKDTGLPLSNGTIECFKDSQRTIQKNLYTLVGNYGFYDYAILPNPLILSATGTMVDEFGNDIVPYAYPFDEEGNRDLYYLVVKNANGIEQFTRQAYPWAPSDTTPIIETTDNINYIKNGQLDNINQDIVINNEYKVANVGESIEVNKYAFINNCSRNIKGSIFIRNSNISTEDIFSIKNISSLPYFNPLIEDIDASTTKCLYYKSTTTTGDSIKRIQFILENVQAFSGKTITFSFYGLSMLFGSSCMVKTYIEQSRGISFNPVITYCTDPTEQPISQTAATKYYFRITVPHINYSLETEESNYLAVGISLPINIPCEFYFFNFQLNDTATKELPYAYDGMTVTSALDISNKLNNIYINNYTDINKNIYGKDLLVPQLQRRHEQPGSYNFNWEPYLPIGSSIIWKLPIDTIPKDFAIENGQSLSQYKFNNLYLKFDSIYSGAPIYGTGSTAIVMDSGQNYLDITNNANGVTTLPVNSINGINLSIISGGTASTPLKYKLTITLNGKDIDDINYLKVYTTNINDGRGEQEYKIRFIKDNFLNNKSPITESEFYDTHIIFVHINSNSSIYTIVSELYKVFFPILSFKLPDTRGYVLRGVSEDSNNDPDKNDRLSRGDGIGGNVVGTIQNDEIKSHNHRSNNYGLFLSSNTGGAGYTYAYNASAPEAVTGDTGGNETRMKNINVYNIMKIM